MTIDNRIKHIVRTRTRRMVLLTVLMTLGLPAVASAACPNEAVRVEQSSTALPECRAYELVSPSFTNGWLIFPQNAQAIHEGPEGTVEMTASSFGAFAGVEDDDIDGPFGAWYDFVRTPEGWQTTPLMPPASRYGVNGQEPFFSEDLTRSVWRLPASQLTPEEGRLLRGDATTFYVREANGSFSPVGPSHPNGEHITGESSATLVGGSADLSTLADRVNATGSEGAVLWPGDGTETARGGIYSLYQYTGPAAEPSLVGVYNQEALHGTPYVNDGAQLISDCGTELGSFDRSLNAGEDEAAGSVYNAVSTNGSMIFFTAEHNAACTASQPPVNELYGRDDGEGTVALSEPALPRADCTGACEVAENSPASRREGIFEGASRDGSKVFFLSEQPLVNGDRDTTMDLYMAEVEGEGTAAHLVRLVMVSGGDETDAHSGEGAEVQGVARVSESGERVYFIATGVLTTKPNLSLSAGHQVAVQGADNLYVYDTESGAVRFVAALSGEDANDWKRADQRPVQSTDDGAYLVFPSVGDLTPGDTSSAKQLFEYDALSEGLARVSIGQEGYNDNGNVFASGFAPNILEPNYELFSAPSISTDPSLDRDGAVFFESADGLTSHAMNRVSIGVNLTESSHSPVYAQNVYEYDDGHVYLISDGKDATEVAASESAVKFWGVTPSGSDVLFSSADRLASSDGSTTAVIYDARVDGGFPNPVASGGCGAEGGCRPAGQAPVVLPAGGSETIPAIAGIGFQASSSPGRSAPRKLTRKQRLTATLKACRLKHSARRRVACEASAKQRFGPQLKVKKVTSTSERMAR